MTSELRQRHQATTQSSESTASGDEDYNSSTANRSRNESVTELPVLQENGERATERTEIPSPRGFGSSTFGGGDSDVSSSTPLTQPEGGDSTPGKGNRSQAQVAKAEGKKTKIVTRVVSGALMIAIFLGLVYMGHLYICLLVAMVELLLVSLIVMFWFILCVLLD